MGSISAGGGGHGGKKSVDSEIPLVPFIDLLLCCIMFLLVTAVWNRMAAMQANQQTPGQPANPSEPPPEEQIQLYLQVTNTGYVISSTAGDRAEIPKNGENWDDETLRTRLRERRASDPNRHDIIVSPEDGVRYEQVIAAMDAAAGEDYTSISVSDARL